MKEAKTTLDELSELRKSAEKSLQGRPADNLNPSELSADELHHLIQELRIHEVELEMKNEERCCAQKELEVARDNRGEKH